MPKGVETPRIKDYQRTFIVNGSEMPKGVEHNVPVVLSDTPIGVNGSEMPKGVEHIPNHPPGLITHAGEWI